MRTTTGLLSVSAATAAIASARPIPLMSTSAVAQATNSGAGRTHTPAYVSTSIARASTPVIADASVGQQSQTQSRAGQPTLKPWKSPLDIYRPDPSCPPPHFSLPRTGQCHPPRRAVPGQREVVVLGGLGIGCVVTQGVHGALKSRRQKKKLL